MSDKVYLTEEGVKKLENELYELRHNKRPAIADKVEEARELGDLKENAEYHAARESLGMCETRIQQIQAILSKSVVIKKDDVSTDSIRILSTVRLKNLSNNKEVTYTLVSQEEADLKSGKISINSPVGKGLLGHTVGETLDVSVPAGVLKFEVLEISI